MLTCARGSVKILILKKCNSELCMSGPSALTSTTANRYALTALEKQCSQLEKLLKDPTAYIVHTPPQRKKQFARNMNGLNYSKRLRKRYEYSWNDLFRIQPPFSLSPQETEEAELERKWSRRNYQCENSKNWQKKKEMIKMKGNGQDNDSSRAGAEHTSTDLPLKKWRLVKELIFRRPEDSSEEDPEEAIGQPDSSLREY